MKLVRDQPKKFLRFTLGGLGLFVLRIALVFAFTDLIGVFFAYSYAAALAIVIVTGYFYNAHIAYRSNNVTKKSFGQYLLSILGFYVLDYVAVLLLVEWFSMYYLLAITLVTPTLFLAKFYTYEKIFSD